MLGQVVVGALRSFTLVRVRHDGPRYRLPTQAVKQTGPAGEAAGVDASDAEGFASGPEGFAIGADGFEIDPEAS